ncbi:MAG: hypothetical protein ABI760_25290 [Ferruginibacter sp.]
MQIIYLVLTLLITGFSKPKQQLKIAVLPAAAYYKPRNRYHTPVLLNYFKEYSGRSFLVRFEEASLSRHY